MRTGLDTWQVKSEDFPAKGADSEKLLFLVNYAVLAPSKYNAQPWLFELCGDSLDLIRDRSWALCHTDPAGREATLSCGAALLNLTIAARHFGYTTRIQTFPWPGDRYLLARVRLGSRVPSSEETLAGSQPADRVQLVSRAGQPAEAPSCDALFRAMKRRCTSRRAFQDRAPGDGTLESCHKAAARYGAWLHVIKDEPTRHAIGELVAQGDLEQMANKTLRRELARWLNRPRSRSKDGFSTSRYGLHGPMTWLTPGVAFGFWAFNPGRLVAAQDRRRAQKAPVLAVLGTQKDDPEAWLAAGQALELVLLQATVAGLSVSFFNQAIEVDHLRTQLAQRIGRAGCPQVLLRLGYGVPAKHTPRRPVKEVLI